jgi:hypothetical protein
MVDHAIKCGPGTPIACRILANASGSLGQLGKTVLDEAKTNDQKQGHERPTIDHEAT